MSHNNKLVCASSPRFPPLSAVTRPVTTRAPRPSGSWRAVRRLHLERLLALCDHDMARVIAYWSVYCGDDVANLRDERGQYRPAAM